jgi:DNA processing protein
MDELQALLTLSHTPKIGPVKIQKLFKQYGSCQNACLALDLKLSDEAQKDIDLAEKFGAMIIPFFDPLYPKQLLSIMSPPAALYIKGKFPNQKKIAIVGTRNASIYGLEMAEKFACDLASQEVAIVSGLARGIDTKAHKGALKNGYTLAVLGSGLLNIYPKENISLASEIIDNGILISEFAMNTPPSKENFPKRNRIVSGLSEAVLLIEAPKEIAKSQNKKLFALPGRVDCLSFEGNLELLHSNKAEVARNANDLLGIDNIAALPSKKTIHLTDDENVVIKLMPNYEISIEEISKNINFPISKLNVVLMGLVLKKLIREYPGKIYKLCEK